jgi:hypothetical protein
MGAKANTRAAAATNDITERVAKPGPAVRM